ncbi:MAG: CNNM domain-containing protein [Parvibaculales bacterium]
MTLLILYLLLAVLVSFFCSVAEAVLLSVRPSYIAALEARGSRSAKKLKALCGNLDRPLAAILTANTIAHTVGAAGVGAQAAVVFGNHYLGLTSAVLTFLILVFSEIIPKTLGAVYWRQLAAPFAVLIDGLTRLLLPFVWLSERLTRLISRSGARDFTFSRDEFEAMAKIGAHEGLLESKEQTIVINLMRLHRLSVRDIMTPRPVVFSVPEKMTVKDFFTAHAGKPFSRIPVYADKEDDVTGYVLKIDLLTAQAKDQFEQSLEQFRRSFHVVPDVLDASNIFDRLIHEKQQIALVLDEYGTMQGIVTMEDVMETLIGLEIMDESDKVEDMQLLAHKRWRERMKSMGIDADELKKD